MSKKTGNIIIGVDEAGRGAWAGPVSAAAFAFSSSKKGDFRKFLADSKTLSESRREQVYDQMHSKENMWVFLGCVAMRNNLVIDTVGIREANRRSMETAILAVLWRLPAGSKAHIQIDGKDNYVFDFWELAPLVEKVEYIVRGDGKVKEIMAASILAKVSRDRHMREMAEIYPNHFFGRHKGYGTALHQSAIKSHWITPIHRTSYAPIREYLTAHKNTPGE